MRIPHYLTRSPSGAYTFRLLVPRHLRDTLGRKVIKRTLYTTDLLTAQTCALSLYSQYKRLFGGQWMGKTFDELLASAQRANGKDWTLERDPFGNITKMQADGPADHKRLMEAVEVMGRQPTSYAPPVAVAVAAAPVPPKPIVAKVLTLGQAKDLWLTAIEPSTIPKTHTIKRSAITQFTAYAGADTKLPDIARPDLAGFFQHLRNGNISTPTIVNKSSYLKHFFEWCSASGYYPEGTSPTVGQVSYKKREKRQRRKLGFKAFTAEQVQHLFAPVNFAALPLSSRWALMIGLYTGARVSEVGQLHLKDIAENDGVLCFNITDDGEHQHLKTDTSIRAVPVHPD